MECEYIGTKIGIDAENGKIDCSNCNNEAINVLRLITIPRSQAQAFLLYKRMCVCKPHAEYLCNDAPFKWENLPSVSVETELKTRKEMKPNK